MEHFPYEGAGFLLRTEEHYILGIRLNEDGVRTGEIEYPGGKVEKGEHPYLTAHNELMEELGGMDVLDPGWQSRVKPLWVFQPFSKKWIWPLLLDLSKQEYARLQDAHARLMEWPVTEKKDLSNLTGRKEPVRKALDGLVQVPRTVFADYVQTFSQIPATKNRMKDAKAFAADTKLTDPCTITGTPLDGSFAVRAFNLVIFETHADVL